MDQRKKVEDLEARLLEAEKELSSLRKKNDEIFVVQKRCSFSHTSRYTEWLLLESMFFPDFAM